MTQNTDFTLTSTLTYAAAYARLAAIAERLRATGSAASIDTLVDDTREARSLHAICRDRIDAVRREFEAEATRAAPDEPMF